MEKKLADHVEEMERAQKEIVKARNQAEQEARTTNLLKSIAATANKTSDTREAIETALELICIYIGFPLAHTYAVDDNKEILRSTKIWFCSEPNRYEEFMNVTEETTFRVGEGSPGRSWDKQKPLWFSNKDEINNSPRLAKLPKTSIQSGFCFPILLNGKVCYILEFFSNNVTNIDTEFLEVLNEISNQITRVVERRQHEIALQQSKNDAEAANAAKSDFLANMSHEIRTPMNGLLGMLTLVLDTDITKQQREWLDIAKQSSETLLDIINDILDISKIEAGELVIEFTPFSLHTTIESITDLLYTRARSRGIRLLIEIEAKVPRRMIGDPFRLRQVIMNLLGNALKFTEIGHIILRVKMSDIEATPIRFEVEDTGIGINESKQAYIFNKFSQEQESTTRKFGGTGLGLTISKKLVGLMGGEIGVISAVGKGSTFWFNLPLTIETSQTEADMFVPDFAKLRVIVLESYPPSRDILSSYFDAWQIHADTFSDPSSVISALSNGYANNNPYHFLFVDADLPKEQWENVVKSAATMSFDKDLIIILNAPPGLAFQNFDLHKNNVAGILTKPIFPSQLFDMMVYLYQHRVDLSTIGLVTCKTLAGKGKPALSQIDEVALKTRTYPGLRILLVEDQRVNQMLMKIILEKLGCIVEIACNGHEAVLLVKTNKYDIILMDCQMPEMDGFEATQHIRALELGTDTHTPIIALTADAMQGDKDRCLAIGMDDYINKPIRPHRIHEVLSQYGTNITEGDNRKDTQ